MNDDAHRGFKDGIVKVSSNFEALADRYERAHAALDEAGVPRTIHAAGYPAALAKRIRMLTEDRDERKLALTCAERTINELGRDRETLRQELRKARDREWPKVRELAERIDRQLDIIADLYADRDAATAQVNQLAQELKDSERERPRVVGEAGRKLLKAQAEARKQAERNDRLRNECVALRKQRDVARNELETRTAQRDAAVSWRRWAEQQTVIAKDDPRVEALNRELAELHGQIADLLGQRAEAERARGGFGCD